MESKPGYKTTEFWLSFAALILSALFASGILPDVGPVAQVIAFISMALGGLGYPVSRSIVKSSEAKAVALLEASKLQAPKL